MLDEPSAGIDVDSRRKLWNVIRKSAETRAVILTSHSMEECERLCTRLGIMVNGEFKCLGTPQHLKSRFGKGMVLELKVRPDRMAALKTHLEHTFDGASLMEQHSEGLQYQIPAQHSAATIFKVMQDALQTYAVVDYGVSQTTLERVFLNLVRKQEEDRRQENAPGA